MAHIAILGSAFNPPSLGHKDVIDQCLAASQFDQIWLVPAYKHAWGKAMAAYAQRCEMLHRFAADLNDPRVVPCCIEHQIHSDGSPVYSIDLLRYLANHYPADRFTLVVGPDNQAAIRRFHCADELLQRWGIFATDERLPVRSTLIRDALAAGQPITQMTTASVVDYLHQHPLYTAQVSE